MSQLAIKLPAHPNQTEFNLRRWEEVLADPFYADLRHRIETDRHGRIIMTPPPGFDHSNRQGKLFKLLDALTAGGDVLPECPISTSDGVRAADLAWISAERLAAVRDPRCLLGGPEIWVEVLSPTNSESEMADKKALYFDAGAKEVWFCREDGKMEFYLGPDRPAEPASRICPRFPAAIE